MSDKSLFCNTESHCIAVSSYFQISYINMPNSLASLVSWFSSMQASIADFTEARTSGLHFIKKKSVHARARVFECEHKTGVWCA